MTIQRIMMTTLIRPDNKQPAEVMRISSGRIALDTTCISPAIRWWTLGELEVVNGRAAVAQACKMPEPEPVQGCDLPPSHIVSAQLDNDIADALALWRKIQVVPGAPVLVLEPDALMAVNESRNVTVIPARAA